MSDASADTNAMSKLASAVLKHTNAKRASGDFNQHTARETRYTLLDFAAMCPEDPRHVTYKHVEKFIGTKKAAGTKRLAYSRLKVFCQWCVIEGHMRSDPTLKVRPPKVPFPAPRSLTVDAVTKVLDACRDPRDVVMVLLMVQEGLRRAEVAAAQLGDLDLNRRVLGVRGKGYEGEVSRYVPITDETADALSTYLSTIPASAGALIRDLRNPEKGVSADCVGGRVEDAFKRSGVKTRPRDGRTPHALRHTAITHIVDSGAPLHVAQQIAGHKSLTTTQRYANGATVDAVKYINGRSYR